MAFSRFAVMLILVGATGQIHAQDLTPDELEFFESKIRPVLIKECYGCHSNKTGNARGGLRLDTRELTHIGGGSGPAIVPGNLEESWLYNAITHQDFVMPPKRKLPQHVIDDFRKWIEMGAPDPRQNDVGEIKSSITEEDIEEARESFWAYQPPVASEPRAVENAAWAKTDIDRFILARLEESGMQPAADAEPWQVLRRLCFDLVGLPPTPEQVDFFTATWNENPDQAIEYVVDRLLDTKQFGERWGRHWLDVVRYAESTGREVNMTYPHAWRYRDYVIDSFNKDKPFDRFVQEQIAGDLLAVDTDEQWSENLVATTFLAIGPKNVNEQNRVQFAADLVDEQIDATTRVFLGMSVACARCHDHKFDAITQSDYYALAGVFGNLTTYFGNPPSEFGTISGPQLRQSSSLILMPVEDPNPYDKRYTSQELADLRNELVEVRRELAGLRRNASGNAANAQRNRIRLLNKMAELSGKLAVVDESGEPRTYCMGVQERDRPKDAQLLVRGEIDQPAQTVRRNFPQVLCDEPVEIGDRSSGRLELARWIGSDQNALTARVFVNRIWQHTIGNGIVTSTENFGATGQAPSHPELLDYLAVRFIDSDWSTKSMIREIVTSRVYRMESAFNESYHELDPDNALIWRANPRRLNAESIRDAMLSVSGEIEYSRPRGSEVAKAGYVRVRNGRLGNPLEAASRRPQSSRPFFAGQGGQARRFGRFGGAAFVTNPLDMEAAKFRSVYLPIVRDEEPRSLAVFDFADASAIIGKRESSNTADQALYMMNNRFVMQQSAAFARRIAEQAESRDEQIELAFRLAYGRHPTPGERDATRSFVRAFAPSTNFRSRDQATLNAVCQSLFASAEFRYVD